MDTDQSHCKHTHLFWASALAAMTCTLPSTPPPKKPPLVTMGREALPPLASLHALT